MFMSDLGRHQAIDEQELGVPRHCRAATSQNGEATLVVPVVDDVLEHIGLGASRHGAEEIALDHVASAGDTGGFETAMNAFQSTRQIEDDAAQRRENRKDDGEEGAAAAADIHHGTESRKIVDRDDSVAHAPRVLGHRLVEDRRLLGVGGEILKAVHAVDVLRRR